ncbi:MAG: YdeI/OmpD-associated family protein [Myxococcota bacterium]
MTKLRKEFAALERVEVRSAAELRAWLEEHHAGKASVALVTFKKVVPERYVSTGEVLDELLAFGWIDGARHKLDEKRTMQLIAPRKTQHWTKSYKQRAARLEAEGRMKPAGRAAIAAAKQSGLWTFMDDVDALIVPPDLRDALDTKPGAAAFFDAAAPSYRRNVLRWVKLAKTEATRARRIAKVAGLSGEGKRVAQM